MHYCRILRWPKEDFTEEVSTKSLELLPLMAFFFFFFHLGDYCKRFCLIGYVRFRNRNFFCFKKKKKKDCSFFMLAINRGFTVL